MGMSECDHDICMCGETFVNSEGYLVTIVPHSGIYNEDEQEELKNEYHGRAE